MSRKKKVDFSGVETFTKAPEGRHTVRVEKIEEATSQGETTHSRLFLKLSRVMLKGQKLLNHSLL